MNSRHVGFLLGIPTSYMSSVHNLSIMHGKLNCSKSVKCSLTPATLFKLNGASPEAIDEIVKRQRSIKHFIEADAL